MAIRSDNLCDLLDDIDNELQAVITLVNRIRGNEREGKA
jgi:hypothetical protein